MSESMGGIIPECPGDFVGIRNFGSATEAVRIIDLSALQVFAKNLDRCNFRVLQQNPG